MHKYLLHHESLSFKNLPSEAESLTHIPSVATVPGVSFWVCFQLKGVKTGASALRTYMYPQCHTHTLNNTQLLTYTPTHTHTQSRCGSVDAHVASVSPLTVRWAPGNPE